MDEGRSVDDMQPPVEENLFDQYTFNIEAFGSFPSWNNPESELGSDGREVGQGDGERTGDDPAEL